MDSFTTLLLSFAAEPASAGDANTSTNSITGPVLGDALAAAPPSEGDGGVADGPLVDAERFYGYGTYCVIA